MRDTHPHLVRLAGVPTWRYADGRLLPLLAGGDDGDEGKAGKADPPEGEGKAEGDGKGGEGEGGGDSEAARAKREAADLRRRLRAVEKERDDLKGASQTDAERLAARAEAAEAKHTSTAERLRKANLRLAVLTAAPSLGVVDPKLAVRLMADTDVAYDDETDEPDPEAVKDGLKALVQEYPHLTRAGDADGGRKGDAPPSTKDEMNSWMRG